MAEGPENLLRGLLLPFRATAYLAARPQLWPLSLAPALLMALGLLSAIHWGSLWATWILGHLWSRPEGLARILWEGARLAVMLAETLVLSLAPPLIGAAPFNDRLSARIERDELGTSETAPGAARFLAETATSVMHSAVRVAILLGGHAVLALVALIPAVNALYPALLFVWSAVWLAFQYLDLTMSRHLYRFDEVRTALGRVRPLGLAMGCTLAVIFIVPLVNLVLVPIGVASGALLYCDLLRRGQLRPPGPAAEPR